MISFFGFLISHERYKTDLNEYSIPKVFKLLDLIKSRGSKLTSSKN